MKFHTMYSLVLVGAIMLMSSCVLEEEGLMDDASSEGLVPADMSVELQEAGATISSIDGDMPLLIEGSLVLGDPAPPSKAINEQIVEKSASLYDSGEFSYKSGMWGTSYDVLVSSTCYGYIRDHGSAYAYDSNGGYCSFQRWYTEDPADCRMIVHVGASAYKHGKCAWSVYANQGGKFSYTASNTSSATQNTTNKLMYLQAGQTLTAGTCGLEGASASGDTYLRITDLSGNPLASNDDACGSLSSKVVYTATSSGYYYIRAGCYSSGSCSGTVVWIK